MESFLKRYTSGCQLLRKLIKLEKRQGLVFGTRTVKLADLSEALVRWRRGRPSTEPLDPVEWGTYDSGLRIPIPVVARPSSAHPIELLEGQASVAALLSLQPVPSDVTVLVATERL